MKLSEKQIEVAVQWWADAICAPKFDNGDQSDIGIAGQMLASILAELVTPEQRAAFEEALAASLRNGELVAGMISVDYHPEPILADAMRTAGISTNNAPWKSGMCFQDGGVQARRGSSESLRPIYPVETGETS